MNKSGPLSTIFGKKDRRLIFCINILFCKMFWALGLSYQEMPSIMVSVVETCDVLLPTFFFCDKQKPQFNI